MTAQTGWAAIHIHEQQTQPASRRDREISLVPSFPSSAGRSPRDRATVQPRIRRRAGLWSITRVAPHGEWNMGEGKNGNRAGSCQLRSRDLRRTGVETRVRRFVPYAVRHSSLLVNSYHSPYPEIKLSNEVEAISTRRAPAAEDAGSVAKNVSSRKSGTGLRRQDRASRERQATRNVPVKTSARLSPLNGVGAPTLVEDEIPWDDASPVHPMREPPPPKTTARHRTPPQSVPVPVRHSSRHVPARNAEASGSGAVSINRDPVNGTLDQYGLEHSPVQISKSRRTALDEQEYDPDSVRTSSRPVKSTRTLSFAQPADSRRRPDDESAARQRRPGKLVRGETQDGLAEAARPPRSLWVCDRCFKFMPIESAYVSHIVSRPCSLQAF